MLRSIIAAAAAVTLAGCAAQVVSTSARSVVVEARVTQAAESQGLADAECQKHGLHARMRDRPTVQQPQFVFDCVP